MSILTILVILVALGVILYFVNKVGWIDGKIKTVINYAVIIGVVLWLLKLVGVFDFLGSVKI